MNKTPAQIAEDERNAETRRKFRADLVDRYGLKEFKIGERNIKQLLCSGGADPVAVSTFVGWGSDHWPHLCIYGRVFDHGELYGKNREPLVFVGQPYNIRGNDIDVLAKIRSFGVGVDVDTWSHYGHGTLRVLIYHARFRELTEKE